MLPDGKKVSVDKVEKVWQFHKLLVKEIDKMQEAQAEATGTHAHADQLSAALKKAREILKKGKITMDDDVASQVLDSLGVLWQAYCATMEEMSVGMSDDSRWNELPHGEHWAPDPSSSSSTEAGVELKDEVRRSERARKTPKQAAEEEDRDESDGLVVGGYGPFLIVRLPTGS